MEEIRDTLARNLRMYRKLAKLSQEKLGEACGLHRTYIGGIEQQRINVSLKNIGKIALALHINPVFLFVDPSFAESMSPQWEAAAHVEIEAGTGAADNASEASEASKTNEATPAVSPASASTADEAHAPNAAASTPVMPGGYALCTWHGDEVQLDPIQVDDPDLAISILVSLIEHGHTDDLAQAFEAAQGYICALKKHERPRARRKKSKANTPKKSKAGTPKTPKADTPKSPKKQ